MILSAGNLRRQNPQLSEASILIKSMEISNIPKFLDEDIPLFNGIFNDLFPKEIIEQNEVDELQDIIKE